jgi:hypothetical protein
LSGAGEVVSKDSEVGGVVVYDCRTYVALCESCARGEE